jgi:ribosomal protein L16/L10AE
MGKGKGAVEYWAAALNPEIMFEVGHLQFKEALRLAAQKLQKTNSLAEISNNLYYIINIEIKNLRN